MRALNAAEETMKRVCNSNMEFMKKIRKLDEKYYPGILKTAAACAVTGVAAGAGGGAVIGGPVGAAVFAVVGMTIGAAGGFLAGGYHAVNKQQRDDEKKFD